MQSYTYQDLEADLKTLKIPFYSIGNTVLGKNIYAFRLGKGEKHILYNGAHHALEWLTPPLLMQFAFDYIYSERRGLRLFGFNIRELYERCCIHIVPMLNPDGIDIATFGTADPELIKMNRGNDFRKTWQSNARGVDLNHNYDAGFELSRDYEYKMGISGPCATRYGGLYPESEPETKAMCDYVRANDFKLCLAMHSQGEVIYYDYNGFVPENADTICKELCKISGYRPDKTDGIASFGGFKDWFILNYKRPAFTVEAGLGKNPLSGTHLSSIYNKVSGIFLMSGFLC